ncbi:MAG: TOBE domain-containing protein [Sulfurimonas sp.]|nr:TOBE domain-containing protein [Sulfurimonas sp.]
MNILEGKIVSIKKVDEFVSLNIEVKDKIFSAVVLDSDSLSWMQTGQSANIIFKEMEVMIATPSSRVSARNAFVSKIKEIEMGELFANVVFDFDGEEISSVITKQSCEELGCREGSEFIWFVKSNEVTIQKGGKSGR